MRRAFPARWQGAVLAVLIAGHLLVSLLWLWSYGPLEDAFITFRYARNLVGGEGLGFNPGERVEGYSSLSWLLLMAAGEAMGLDPPAFSRGLGLAFGVATMLLVASGPFDAGSRLLAVGLLAVHLPWTYHALNGLETAMVAFLVTALLLLPATSGRLRLARHVVAAGLVITRPEGLLLVCVHAGAVLLADRAAFTRHHLAICATSAAVFAGHTAWRWSYHGDWIANSARAKLLPLEVALPRGLEYLAGFALKGTGYGALLLLAGAGAFIALRRWDEPESRRLAALLVFCVLAGLVLAASGGDSLALWRFLVPLAPAFFLCAARGLHMQVRPGWPVARIASYAALALALGISADRGFPWITPGARLNRDWAEMGRGVKRVFPPETRMALCPAGILAFYSGFYTIDMLGLNERAIARRPPDLSYYYPGHQRHDGAYVLGLEPDLILLANGPVVQQSGFPFDYDAVLAYEADIVSDPRFAARYRLIDVPLESGKYVQMFASSRFLARGLAGQRVP